MKKAYGYTTQAEMSFSTASSRKEDCSSFKYKYLMQFKWYITLFHCEMEFSIYIRPLTLLFIYYIVTYGYIGDLRDRFGLDDWV
jgi:hypothetical protein